MRYFFIIGSMIASLLLQAKEKEKINLTRYINEVEQIQQIKVSYSPSVTDTIYPIVPFSILSLKKPATELLSELLKGTGYGIASVKGLMYLYKEPLNPRKLPDVHSPVSSSVVRDTLRVPPLSMDSIRMRPHHAEMDKVEFNGVSTWDYLIRVDRQQSYMKWNIYSNLLLLSTGTINMGTNFGIAPKWTLGGMFSYNPWMYGKARIKHILIRPEVRYWLCDNFGGHFLSANLTYARYNAGGIALPLFSDNIKNNRYQGNLGGFGLSYGYSWVLGKRVNLEVEIGVGISHTKYTKYPCTDCGRKIKTDKKTFVSPNKFAVNLVYVLK